MTLTPAENRRARTLPAHHALPRCVLLFALCAAALLAPVAASARTAPLVVVQGKGRLVGLEGKADDVFAADPKIVEVRPASGDALFVFGIAPGETTIVATNKAGRQIADFAVTVTPGHYAADRFQGAAAAIAHGAAPSSPPHAVPDGKGLTLRGRTETPLQAAELGNLAQQNLTKGETLDDRLDITGPVQVTLKVRVAEMARNVTRQLGINWQSIGNGVAIGKFVFGFQTLGNLIGGGGKGTPPGGVYSLAFPPDTVPIDGILNALSEDNLARILAEPTLTALSGQTADFIDGGSFPVPVPGPNGEVGVQFKNYGVQLGFTPTVLNSGQIILHVNPTVSSTSSANSFAITVGSTNFVVPSLVEQSASTTVVLGSGQTLAIAGLFQDDSNQSDSSVPGLGDIPIIGGAFHNDSYSRQQRELVILVTPYLVRPVSDPAKLRVPGQDWTPPNDLQRLIFGHTDGSSASARAIPGDAGFLLD